MKISYAITTKDELPELIGLCSKLERWLKEVNYEWEIVILKDYFEDPRSREFKLWEEYMFSIDDKLKNGTYRFFLKPFGGDFSEHKNTLNSDCSGNYIFQIDADEYPSSVLVDYLGNIIERNPGVDLVWVPRVNTVKGLTDAHIQKWGWRTELLEGTELPAINWPDYQSRIYRNDPKIHWVNKVHEHIEGADKYTRLPAETVWALFHHKTIEKQEQQNRMYSTMQR